MFRIVFMVDDRDLAKALHALAGIARQMEPPMPVVNTATAANGRIIAATRGNSHDVVRDFLVRSKATIVSKKQLGEALVKHGYRASSVEWVRKKLFAEGFIKATRERGVFQVVERKDG
jgi:hypothetical protein